MHATVWRSEVNFQELLISFRVVSHRDQTQAVLLGSGHLCPLSYFTVLCSSAFFETRSHVAQGDLKLNL